MAATMIAPTAYADTTDELLGQAAADLTQATQVLEQVPTTALDAREASGIAAGETFQTDVAQQLTGIETLQDSFQANLPDQTSPLLVSLDQQVAQASQELLTADQGVLSAADAGDLSTFAGQLTAGLPVDEGVFATLGDVLNIDFTDLAATFDPLILTAF